MIDPTEHDLGRAVVYRDGSGQLVERGVIIMITDPWVFVRYGSDTVAKATRRQDLEWMAP